MSKTDLHWLARLDKTLVVPEVMFVHLNGAGGKYFAPRPKSELRAGMQWVDLSRGAIVVDPGYPELIPSILAHEWRHHWQQERFPKQYRSWTSAQDAHPDYESAIVDYFTSSSTEADALWFASYVSPSWLTEYIIGDCLKQLPIPLGRI